jgi:hypothetical protein
MSSDKLFKSMDATYIGNGYMRTEDGQEIRININYITKSQVLVGDTFVIEIKPSGDIICVKKGFVDKESFIGNYLGNNEVTDGDKIYKILYVNTKFYGLKEGDEVICFKPAGEIPALSEVSVNNKI